MLSRIKANLNVVMENRRMVCMTIKLSLQEAQDLYRRTNKIRREKEYLRASMQRVKDILEGGPLSGAAGEEAVRQCLAVLNEALGVTGDVE